MVVQDDNEAGARNLLRYVYTIVVNVRVWLSEYALLSLRFVIIFNNN